MGLQPDGTVGDVDPLLFELAHPLEVVLLVEAGLEFDHHRHLLAVLGGVDERLDHLGVAGGAVDGSLDREHVRVLGSRREEPLDRPVEVVVRVVKQDVALADVREHARRVLVVVPFERRAVGPSDSRVRLGRPGFAREVRPVEVGHRLELPVVQRPR